MESVKVRSFLLLGDGWNSSCVERTQRGARSDGGGMRAGKTTSTIRSEIGDDWDIWTMGCPEGESPDQIRDRCDRVIKKIVDMAE